MLKVIYSPDGVVNPMPYYNPYHILSPFLWVVYGLTIILSHGRFMAAKHLPVPIWPETGRQWLV